MANNWKKLRLKRSFDNEITQISSNFRYVSWEFMIFNYAEIRFQI